MTPREAVPDATIHASCVVIGERGILIRGPSGAGKSTLARQLVAAARRDGRFARLVSDDRTRVGARHGRVVAWTVEALAGQIEVRGIGLFAVQHEPAAVVHLVVDLTPVEPPRLPSRQESTVELCGVDLARVSGRARTPITDVILAHIGKVDHRLMTA